MKASVSPPQLSSPRRTSESQRPTQDAQAHPQSPSVALAARAAQGPVREAGNEIRTAALILQGSSTTGANPHLPRTDSSSDADLFETSRDRKSDNPPLSVVTVSDFSSVLSSDSWSDVTSDDEDVRSVPDAFFTSDLCDWWEKQRTLSPQDKLMQLESRGDLAKQLLNVLRADEQPDDTLQKEAAYALLVEMSEREDQSIRMLAGTASDSNTNACQVRTQLIRAQHKNLLPVQAEALLRLRLKAAPSCVRSLLADLGDSEEDFAQFALEVLDEMSNRIRTEHGSTKPMSTKECALASIRVLANGPREGFSQYLSRILVHGGYLAGVSAFSLTARFFLSTGTLFATQFWAFRQIEMEKSEGYRRHPSGFFTIMQVLSIAVPAIMAVTILATHAHGWPPEAIELAQNAMDLLAVNEIGRVVREFFQSWSRSQVTAGLDLVHADGTGLTAREQRWMNLVRDALYTATSLLLLCGGPALAKEWLAKVAASVVDTSSAFAAAALLNIFTGLNDMCEGWTMDSARVICRRIWGDDFVLRPGNQHNPGIDPTHYFIHTASRLTTGPLIDLFMAAAAAVQKMGGSAHAVNVLLSSGALTNGMAGGWRNRVATRLGSVSVDEDGTKASGGLAAGISDAARYGAGTLWSALTNAAAWVGHKNTTEPVALTQDLGTYLRSPASEASVSGAMMVCAG